MTKPKKPKRGLSYADAETRRAVSRKGGHALWAKIRKQLAAKKSA